MSTEAETTAGADGKGGPGDTLTVTDNRTGRTYEIPIVEGAIRSLDLRQIQPPTRTSACSPTTRHS